MSNRRKAILSLVTATFFMALMASLVRLAGDLPIPQKLFYRNLIILAFSIMVMKKKKIPFQIKSDFLKPVLLRGVLGTAAMLLHFYTIDYMSLADANMLNKLSSFFVVVFSFFILKEKIRPTSIVALAVAFIGALFIIKPSGDNAALVPSLSGLLGGILGGAAFAELRAACVAGAPKELTIVSFAFVTCIMTLPSMLLHYVPMSMEQTVIILLCGLTGAVAHMFNSKAYSMAPSNQISAFDYCQVLFSALFGFLIFQQMPDAWSVIGYCIIIGTGVVVFLKDQAPSKNDCEKHGQEI